MRLGVFRAVAAAATVGAAAAPALRLWALREPPAPRPAPVPAAGGLAAELAAVAGEMDPPAAAAPACALAFFGQLKNLNESLARNIADSVARPLAARCAAIDAYLHTYALAEATNPANRELAAPLDMPGSLRLLLATLRGAGVRVAGVEFSSREAGLAFSRAPEYYLQRGEPWPYNPRVSLVNFLLQQYSLDRVSELWWPHRSRYAVVAYLRPDLFFFNPLPVPEPVENATLYAPDFDTWGGINDRFGFGTPWTMDHYGHRMRLAEAYFREVPPRRGGIKNYKKMVWADGSMHSETFLRETMRMCGVRYAPIQNFTFGRVRAHGAVV